MNRGELLIGTYEGNNNITTSMKVVLKYIGSINIILILFGGGAYS